MYIIFYLIQLPCVKIVTLKKKFRKYQRKEEKYHKSYPRDAIGFRSFYFSK